MNLSHELRDYQRHGQQTEDGDSVDHQGFSGHLILPMAWAIQTRLADRNISQIVFITTRTIAPTAIAKSRFCFVMMMPLAVVCEIRYFVRLHIALLSLF